MKPKLLYLTDLHYKAKGRVYCEEDIRLSADLNQAFDLVLCGPASAEVFLTDFDLILFRNTGPVMYFSDAYRRFRDAAVRAEAKVFNQLTGMADMIGKQYLVNMTAEGLPVIPTADTETDAATLPAADQYVSKLKEGADSLGMVFYDREELSGVDFTDRLVQPRLDFEYEVSFYFINDEFQYALFAPNPDMRWKLEVYEPNDVDLKFASQFIEWNRIEHGIQRVDACRTMDGRLLLMELEDLNPYLSLDCVPDHTRDQFVSDLTAALMEYAKV